MTSPLMAALEGQVEEAEMEIEYSYFIELSQEQLAAIIDKYKEVKMSVFAESKLAYNEARGLAGRIRRYIDGDDSTYELTTKAKSKEAKGKLESNIELDEMNYHMLTSTAKSTVVRTRMYIPVRRTDGTTIQRKNGDDLVWELDLYVDARGNGEPSLNSIHPWTKLEMEVDKATLDSVVDYIPFEYEELIHSDTQEDTERALIDNLYAVEYDVLGKMS